MGNTITIELCAEDRARLDRLAEALERKACDKCVENVVEYFKTAKNDIQEQEASEAVTEPVCNEKASEKEFEALETSKTVDRSELRSKVIELSAKGLKEQARDIVRAYAQTVTAVPEDKVTECYMKLVALEG